MTKKLSAVLSLVLLVFAACGDAGADDPAGGAGAEATRTVEITMVDTAYEPETVTVARGENVRFVFTNTGKIRHEAYLGTRQQQSAHEREMREAGEDGGGHGDHGGGDDDGNKVSVDPGETGELTTTFGESGRYEIGCHEPGHYAAGMTLTVDVT